MIHIRALANLALQKFKAGTISIWQGGGKRLVLGSVWCGALAASLASRCPAAGNGTTEATPSRTVTSCPTGQLPKKYDPATNKRGAEAWEKPTASAKPKGLRAC